MKDSRQRIAKLHYCRQHLGESGVAALELALILPLLVVMVFMILDFGRLLQARLVVTNVAREGGSLASRDIQSATNLIALLQTGASPLDLATTGKIYIWKIRAGTKKNNPAPSIDLATSANGGALSVGSSIGSQVVRLGLSADLYDHLVFNDSQNTADISELTVVEVFYKYTPITPLSNFIPGLLTSSGGGTIISSRAVF
jgi:Flp pilus assembly protein TadG